jgi:hypothetical protein
MFVFISTNIYTLNKMEVTEINDTHIKHLYVLHVLNAWLSFEMAEPFILKLIIA